MEGLQLQAWMKSFLRTQLLEALMKEHLPLVLRKDSSLANADDRPREELNQQSHY